MSSARAKGDERGGASGGGELANGCGRGTLTPGRWVAASDERLPASSVATTATDCVPAGRMAELSVVRSTGVAAGQSAIVQIAPAADARTS